MRPCGCAPYVGRRCTAIQHSTRPFARFCADAHRTSCCMGQHMMCVVGFVQAGRADEPLKPLKWWRQLHQRFSFYGYKLELLHQFGTLALDVLVRKMGKMGFFDPHTSIPISLFATCMAVLYSFRLLVWLARCVYAATHQLALSVGTLAVCTTLLLSGNLSQSYFSSERFFWSCMAFCITCCVFIWLARCVNAVAHQLPLSSITSVYGDGLLLWNVVQMADFAVAFLFLLVSGLPQAAAEKLLEAQERWKEAQSLATATTTPENRVPPAGRNGARRGRSPAHTRTPNPVPTGESLDDTVESNARDALAGMSEDEVRSWLVKLGHADSALVLRTSHTAGDVLEDLTDSDLEKMGIASVVERKRLLALFNAASTIGPGAVATSRVEHATQRRGGRHRQSPHR